MKESFNKVRNHNSSLNFNGCVMDNEEITSLLVLPFTHVYGFMLMLTSLLFGNKLIFLSRFEEDLFLSCIEVSFYHKN